MRLDQFLLHKGYFKSREKAKEAIENSRVFVDEELCTKPAYKIIGDREVRVLDGNDYVSRAGKKLETAMKRFKVSAKDKTCLDVGSSTGGFTEYLLKDCAKEVYAVDVGTDQMDREIAHNPKVHLFENTDIRDFHTAINNWELIVVDVSFISLRKIMPAIKKLANPKTEILLLFKPQFEVGKNFLKKGIVRHPNIQEVLDDFEDFLKNHKLCIKNLFKVPLRGKQGNQEYFLNLTQSQ